MRIHVGDRSWRLVDVNGLTGLASYPAFEILARWGIPQKEYVDICRKGESGIEPKPN
jgi:hypothetical protein